MKKMQLLIAVIVSAAAMLCTGCDNSKSSSIPSTDSAASNSSTTENSDTAKPADGVTFTYTANGTEIAISAESDPIVQALGEPTSTFEAPSCAFEGTSYTYTYDGFTLETYPDAGVNRVYAITLTDATVKTAEGVKVGDTVDTVHSLCGEPDQSSNFFDMYTTDGAAVQFFYDNGDGIVTSIVYTYR